MLKTYSCLCAQGSFQQAWGTTLGAGDLIRVRYVQGKYPTCCILLRQPHSLQSLRAKIELENPILFNKIRKQIKDNTLVTTAHQTSRILP